MASHLDFKITPQGTVIRRRFQVVFRVGAVHNRAGQGVAWRKIIVLRRGIFAGLRYLREAAGRGSNCASGSIPFRNSLTSDPCSKNTASCGNLVQNISADKLADRESVQRLGKQMFGKETGQVVGVGNVNAGRNPIRISMPQDLNKVFSGRHLVLLAFAISGQANSG